MDVSALFTHCRLKEYANGLDPSGNTVEMTLKADEWIGDSANK